MRLASKLATPEGAGHKAGRLKNYITGNQFGAAQVRTIAQPYFDLLDAEKPRRASPESETETKTTGLRLVTTG